MAEQRDDRVPFEPIHGRQGFRVHIDPMQFPDGGMPAEEAYELLAHRASCSTGGRR